MCNRDKCTMEPGSVTTVDTLLGQKLSFVKVGRMTGIAKSIIGRHSFYCRPREAAKKLKEEKEAKLVKQPPYFWIPTNQEQHPAIYPKLPKLPVGTAVLKVIYQEPLALDEAARAVYNAALEAIAAQQTLKPVPAEELDRVIPEVPHT